MRAEEALAQSNGKPIYAIYRGDLFKLWQRADDGHYILEFSDVEDTNRRGTYISHSLAWILKRDRRYVAEWYSSEQEARDGKRPEEFYIYTMTIYQHKETKDVIYVKFCNGEVIAISHSRLPKHRITTSAHSYGLIVERDTLRDFLLNSNQYLYLASFIADMNTQGMRDEQWIAQQQKRTRSYHYVYFNLRDGREHDEWVSSIKEVSRLANAHFRGTKKRPLSVEGPDIGNLTLSFDEVTRTIPELEKYV